ncbi:hypothetical protein [Wenyingzhuangia marina]|uniref:hypothetical protein n=1 Tax=Wenyingzhuangia marina TaxID=1195760 RepID=UPI00116077CD|nr:hypothetical protein [Wenyingzhuangia marina]
MTTIELGGNSGTYSLNGEFEIFEKNNYSLNTRLGFGYVPLEDTQYLAIPFGFNVLTGKGKHHLEGGLGLSYIQGLTFKFIPIGNSEKNYSDEAIYFVPSIGYRFDKLTKGFVFKIYYSPLIMMYDFFDENQFIDNETKGVTPFGQPSKKDWVNYFNSNDFFPKATSKYGNFGITIGYRF